MSFHLKNTTFLLTAMLLVALAPAKAGGDILLVGDGDVGTCAFIDIQDAIDAANPGDEIRVTREINGVNFTYFENLSIDKDLVLKGGYSNCSLAELDSRIDESRTIIDGSESGNVIKIDADELLVEISGFTLTGGVDQGGAINRANGGGISIVGDGNEIVFEHMTLINNHGRLGGGIYLSGNANVMNLSDNLITNNSATSGGGVYCESTEIDNTINNFNLTLTNNQALGDVETSGHGGGFYLSGCNFLNLFQSGLPGLFLIANNQANNSGGGIYAVDITLGQIYGTLSSNIANADSDEFGNGGGIFALNINQLYISYAYLLENQVNGGYGGAIYAKNVDLAIVRDRIETCQLNYSTCLTFQGNLATPLPSPLPQTLTFGGAIYLNNSTLLSSIDDSSFQDHFIGTFIDNRADIGSALMMEYGSKFSFQNTYFIANGENNDAFSAYHNLSTVSLNRGENSQLMVTFSTLVNNQVNDVFNLNPANSLVLLNSIIHEETTSNDVIHNNLSLIQTGCNVLHESDSVIIPPLQDNTIVTDDPGFVDAENGNFHLSRNSSAIDMCNAIGLGLVYPDQNNDERPIDIKDNDNGFGAFDAGAD
ncbi:MAG: hypothetical protein ACSHWU_06310, partial [Marinicella sp.]